MHPFSFFSASAFHEISDIINVIPQFCEEFNDINSSMISKDQSFLNNVDTPTENFENLVANGHQIIDNVFSTDQSDWFSVESKANDFMNDFMICYLPPPGAVFKNISDTKKFIKAGEVIDRAGYTKAGRSLMKHGYREGSVFPKPVGNPAQVNAHGQQVLESIITHPERIVYENVHPDFGKVIEIIVPEKWGVRFTIEGEMIGFLEP